MRRMGFAPLALASLWFALVPAAHAADGRLEIHQACVATGCFPGDAPGFPVQITTSGSYLLTSDLAVPDAGTTAIRIDGDQLVVTVDLNGFSINGPTRCGFEPACAPLGGGAGVFQGSTSSRVTVLNGKITGMGSSGVSLSEVQGRVEGVSVSHSNIGILNAQLVRGNIVTNCGVTGVQCINCLVLDNVIGDNKGDGVFAFTSAVVRDNVIYRNSGLGINALSGEVAYGGNQLRNNNGGNANPQVSAAAVEVGPNQCGDDTVCP